MNENNNLFYLCPVKKGIVVKFYIKRVYIFYLFYITNKSVLWLITVRVLHILKYY